MQFLKTNILQGSVATPFRCGWLYNDLFIANFLLSVTVKEFLKNWSIFGKDMNKFGVLVF